MRLDSSAFQASTGRMEATEPLTAVGAGRTSPSLIGAAVAVGLGVVILASLAIGEHLGVNSSALLDRPDVVVMSLAFSGALGWRLGSRATNGNGWQTALTGIGFGVSWAPVALIVYALAGVVDAELRGVFQPGDSPIALALLLYGLATLWIYGAVVSIPLGIAWAFACRAVSWSASRMRQPRSRPRPPHAARSASTAAFLVGLLLISGLGGTAMTLRYVPWATRCLDLPGGTPSAASFSPAGDLLAITAHSDSSRPGTVLLLAWPSGRLIGQWSAWVDRAVAVAPDGQVYWSSADFGSGTNGILTTRAGSQPTRFTGPNGGSFTDLAWTTAGLRGVDTTIDEVGSLPFEGDHSVVINDGSSDNVGAFWVSPDGKASAMSTFGPAETVEVTTPSGTVSIPTGPVQSIALTADYDHLVAAQANGGLNLIEIASGRSHQLMPGSQEFVALSRRGDIAWLNDEAFGYGRLCTSTLAQLGG